MVCHSKSFHCLFFRLLLLLLLPLYSRSTVGNLSFLKNSKSTGNGKRKEKKRRDTTLPTRILPHHPPTPLGQPSATGGNAMVRRRFAMASHCKAVEEEEHKVWRSRATSHPLFTSSFEAFLSRVVSSSSSFLCCFLPAQFFPSTFSFWRFCRFPEPNRKHIRPSVPQ